MVVGEGNKEQLIEFVGCGLEVYKDIIDHRPLPISVGETAAPSGLLYPTKVLVQDDELVISDAGHHRLLICSLDGHVKVGLSHFFLLLLPSIGFINIGCSIIHAVPYRSRQWWDQENRVP